MLRNNFFYKNIPNFFTLTNLFFGVISIVLASEGNENLVLASYFIYFAAVFDFFDGFAARTLKVSSIVGKELDSLADMVSFGLAPSFLVYQILKHSLQIKQFSFSLPFTDILMLMSAFLIAIFSAVRLAKFNVDERQKETFLGLATPACAMLIASIPFISQFNTNDLIAFPALSNNIYFFLGTVMFGIFIIKPIVLIPLVFLLSALLVVEMPMFSMKFKTYNFEENKLKYFFIIFSLVLFITLQVLAVPIIFILYISFSIFNNILDKKIL
ncbi:MAG: CDP-alcohol phosphatidyltransferase family protein [Bacteroidales bacterium]|nr:CDP-alcohol phosphatidyltransferase family protein [Bacteroidales bacterium]